MFMNAHFTYMWHTIQDVDNNKMIDNRRETSTAVSVQNLCIKQARH